MSEEQRQYFRWAFYRFDASWRALDRDARRRALDELEAVLAPPAAEWQSCYRVLGLRADADFGVWLKDERGIEPLQEFERNIRASAAGDHLVLAHNFISMTKPSPRAASAWWTSGCRSTPGPRIRFGSASGRVG